jgi:hypothetical protein
VGDPVLQQVPDAAGLDREQVGRVALLDVLRQHQHGDVRVLAAQDQRGPDALVGVGRRHADVDHGEVGPVLGDRPQELAGVGHGLDDLQPGVGHQGGEPLAEQDRVLGDHDSHGSSTVIVVGPPTGLSTVIVPSTAPAR